MPIEWPVAHPTLSRDAPFLILFEGPAIHMAIPVGPKGATKNKSALSVSSAL